MFRASLTPLKCHHPRWRLKRRNELKRTAMRIGAVHISRCRNGRLKSNLRSHARTRDPKTNNAWKNAMNQGRFSNRSLGKFKKNFFMGWVGLPLLGGTINGATSGSLIALFFGTNLFFRRRLNEKSSESATRRG